MSDEDLDNAFLAAIREHPEDDAPRLIFADWLEERGRSSDAAHAEFIRIQCALAEKGESLDRHQSLAARERELLGTYATTWKRPLQELGATHVFYRRGFPDEIIISAANFLDNACHLFALAPIRKVRISPCSRYQLQALACSPHLRNLTALDLSGNYLGDDGVRVLASSKHLAGLEELRLGASNVGPAGLMALASSPNFAKLTGLDLGGNRIGDEGVRVLVSSPHLRNLIALNLHSNTIGPSGARRLAASPNLTKLKTLNLRFNQICTDGTLALASSPYLPALNTLDLTNNDIGSEGALALASSRCLGSLESLFLNWNGISPEVARKLVESSRLPNLITLGLNNNALGECLIGEINRTLMQRAADRGTVPARMCSNSRPR